MPQFVLKVKCPACGYVSDDGVVNARNSEEAKRSAMYCPRQRGVRMEVIEVKEKAKHSDQN